MKFTFLHWLVVGLLAIIIYLILSRPSKPDSAVIIRARDTIESIYEKNRILRMNVRTLELTIQDTNVKKKADSARFVKEITVKNQQLARKRVQIDTVFKDSPVLQSYLQTADSAFAMMHGRIDSLEKEKAFQASLYTDLIYLGNKQITNLNVIISQKDIIVADQAKTIKKRSRGNRLLKVAVVTLPVLSLIVGTQL